MTKTFKFQIIDGNGFQATTTIGKLTPTNQFECTWEEFGNILKTPTEADKHNLPAFIPATIRTDYDNVEIARTSNLYFDDNCDPQLWDSNRYEDEYYTKSTTGKKYWFDDEFEIPKYQEFVDEYNDVPFIRRSSKNIENYSMLVLDYDDGMTIEEFKKNCKVLEFYLYTSSRHLKDGTTEKFRVVIPLLNEVPKEELENRTNNLKQLFTGVDNTTFSISRLFFLSGGEDLSKFEFHHNKGIEFDLLQVPSTPKPQSKPKTLDQILYNQSSNRLTNLIVKIKHRHNGKLHHKHLHKIAQAMHNEGFDHYVIADVVKTCVAASSATSLKNVMSTAGQYSNLSGGTLDWYANNDAK